MTTLPDAARELETRIRAQIPLTRAIDLRIRDYDGDGLTMAAPLAANINDKGCAFGGSLTSVMTIAGWALTVSAIEARGLVCDVFVGRSESVYRAPVWADFEARATLAAGASWDTFFATLGKRGKARISLVCSIRETDGAAACATLTADFVAKQTADAGHNAAMPDAAQ